MNNPFWEQQQQLFKMWNAGMGNSFPGMEAYQNMYKNMMPDFADYWKKYTENMPDVSEYWKKYTEMMPNVTEYWNKFAEMMPNAGEYWNKLMGMMPGPDAFAKMWNAQLPGMDIFNKVMDFWKGMGNPATFVKDYQEKYMDIMQDFFKSILPAGTADFMAKPMELMQTCVDFYNNVMSPWMKIDDSIMERIAAGDQAAYLDFFKDFQAKYEESFEKVFNMMGFGLNREANEDQMHAINSYIKMIFTSGELSALVMDAAKEGMEMLVERYQAGLQEGKMVTTFREFYDLWYRVNEEVLLKLFNTDEFSKIFGDFADKYSKYLMAANTVVERMLAPLPIPTKTDMDSLYLTVYNLRKDVRDLRREMDALKEEKAAEKK